MTEEYFSKTIERNNQVFEQFGIKENDGVWVFGYGSLLWKVNFKYTEKRVGCVHGYVRRLWQESRDHRGTPDHPGRVATLVPVYNEKQLVWGIIYYIPPEHIQEAMDILNFREKDGYTLKTVRCYERITLKERDVILYVAVVDNSESVDDIARIVATTTGPSGPNCEYLFKMAEALRENDIETEDDKTHILLLEKRVKKLQENNRCIHEKINK